MNRRGNPILTFSLCTALVVHLLGFSAMALWYADHHPNPNLPPINKWKVLAEIPAMAVHRDPLPKKAPAKPEPPKPKSTPPPPPPRPKPRAHELPKPDLTPPPKDDSGETNGKGTANRSTDGQKPMEARTGLEQADLMKALANEKLLVDPNALNPASAGELNGSNDPRQAASAVGVQQPKFVAESDELVSADADPAQPTGGPPVPGGPGYPMPTPRHAAPKENHPAASGAPTATPDAKSTLASENRDHPKAVKGHLATASDTDSVALRPEGSFEFKSGKLVARDGLRVKFSQPRFGLASETDLESMGQSEMVLQVEVGADGGIIDVQIARSSGSSNVDNDIQQCMYGCEFAPEKDKDGHPKPETVWTIHILL